MAKRSKTKNRALSGAEGAKAKISAESPPAQTAKPKQAAKKVWRFIDYDGRWAGGCDNLHSLPKYIKWYINAWEGCEGEVLVALNQLRAERDFIWLQGALVELLSRATNTDARHQGYILTSRRDPASASEVGRMLRLTGRGMHKQAEAALQKLSRAGFLEYVPMPTWDGSGQPRNVTTSKQGANRQKKPGSKAKNAGDALKGKGKSAAQKEKGERERSAPQTKENRRQMIMRQLEQMQDEGKGQNDATTAVTANRGQAPSAAPSTSSTRSDAGQARREPGAQSGRTPAPPSVKQLGDIVKLSAFRYDAGAWDFADDVLVKCGYFTSLDVERARQGQGYESDQQNERAHWAKAWHTAAGLSDADSLAWLRAGILKRAGVVARSRHSKKNPQSYLMASWNNLVKDRKRKGKAVSGAG
ncbi:MAG: hypothetical protein ACYSP9_04130 [Planctomycetota bacterium]|jgi:hypothetical protein